MRTKWLKHIAISIVQALLLKISVQSLLRPLSHHALAWHDLEVAFKRFGSSPSVHCNG